MLHVRLGADEPIGTGAGEAATATSQVPDETPSYHVTNGIAVADDETSLGWFRALQRVCNDYFAEHGVSARYVIVDGRIGDATIKAVQAVLRDIGGSLGPSYINATNSTAALAASCVQVARMISEYGGVMLDTYPSRRTSDYRGSGGTSTGTDTNGNGGGGGFPWRKVAIGGAIAAGAWLLFFRKRRG